MRLVISGGAGFLGSHLCDFFLARGDEVVAVDNFLTGRPENVAHLTGQPHFQLLTHDVITPLPVAGPLDAILHFASPASPKDYLRYPLETLRTGSLGTLNLLELAARTGARFLLASTSEVYGDPLVHPQTEDYWGNVNPVGVRSVYDETKRFGEALTVTYGRTGRAAVRIARIFNTYGPRMRSGDGRVVPTMIVQALRGEPLSVYGTGRQTRSFCYVSDLVAGIARLLASDCTDPVNLGNPAEFSILELAAVIARLAGAEPRLAYQPLPADDPRQRRPDISRARTVLGWEPTVALEAGLAATLEWFRGQSA